MVSTSWRVWHQVFYSPWGDLASLSWINPMLLACLNWTDFSCFSWVLCASLCLSLHAGCSWGWNCRKYYRYISVVVTILCMAEFGYNLWLLNYSGKRVPKKGTLIKKSEVWCLDIRVALKFSTGEQNFLNCTSNITKTFPWMVRPCGQNRPHNQWNLWSLNENTVDIDDFEATFSFRFYCNKLWSSKKPGTISQWINFALFR